MVGPDGLLFAKNSDRPPDEPQVVRSFPRRDGGPRATVATQHLELPDPGAHAFLGSQPTWLWGVEHGVNEHGVAIGNEKLYTTGRPKAREPALLGMDLVRLGLERGRTADEALAAMTALLEMHGQGGSGERDSFEPYDSSFLVADASGGWILETCDRTWAARPIGAGAAISNRITLATDWTLASPDLDPGTDFQTFRHPRVPTSIADHRLAATRACVHRGADLDLGDLVATSRDHGSGPWGAPGDARAVPPPTDLGPDNAGVTVCMHVRGYQATTAAMVAAVPRAGAPRVAVALGSPCASVFVPLADLVTVPPELSAPETWARFATLRDRVEADGGALADIRSVLAPLEQAWWEHPPTELHDLDAALTTLGG
ncbi:MAG: hypothetical protein ACXVJZ_10775 [Acidimicrobiia bacterium]